VSEAFNDGTGPAPRLAERDAQAQTTAEAVARRSYGKLVALLAARTHDVAAAEDGLSEAFAAALADWPLNGCPSNPEAWLLTVARRKLIDMARRQHNSEMVDEDLANIAIALETANEIPDRRLALMFACAHPAIDSGIRAPLILQVILGIDADAIASAFLMSPAAMSKRLVRAKRKIREAGIPFRIPDREELPSRLESVLEAIYAAFAESWSDASGTEIALRDLTNEAFVLARMIVEMMPMEPEALGLLALMLHSEARRKTRRSERGEYIPLTAQDPDQWNSRMIDEAESLLHSANALGVMGRYQLEAAVQSAHVYRCRTGHGNWEEILQIYDALLVVTGSPVVAINRALAIAELHGAQVALGALPDPTADARLATYQPYWAAWADLLARAHAYCDAHRAYEIAIGLERDPSVRTFLERRQSALEPYVH